MGCFPVENEDGVKIQYNRKTAREEAFKLIFQAEHQGDEIQELLNDCVNGLPFKPQDKAYILAVVNGVIEHIEHIDAYIDQNAKGWKKQRFSKVCVTAVRLAIFEILYMDDIPVAVSINEAIELIKKYDVQEAAAFANGILGSIQKKFEALKGEK